MPVPPFNIRLPDILSRAMADRAESSPAPMLADLRSLTFDSEQIVLQCRSRFYELLGGPSRETCAVLVSDSLRRMSNSANLPQSSAKYMVRIMALAQIPAVDVDIPLPLNITICANARGFLGGLSDGESKHGCDYSCVLQSAEMGNSIHLERGSL